MYRKIEKLVDRELSKYRLNENNILFIGRKLAKFGELSGWENKEKHIITYISFTLELCEKYEINGKIQETLVNLYDHFERAGHAPYSCNWAGCLAADKWESLWIEKGELN